MNEHFQKHTCKCDGEAATAVIEEKAVWEKVKLLNYPKFSQTHTQEMANNCISAQHQL